MQWLLCKMVPDDAAAALRRHGHIVHYLAEAGLTDATGPAELVDAAHARQWDLLTADAEVYHLLMKRRWFSRTAVMLTSIGNGGGEAAIDRLFARFVRLSPAMLYVANPWRVKVRQLNARRGPKPRKHKAEKH